MEGFFGCRVVLPVPDATPSSSSSLPIFSGVRSGLLPAETWPLAIGSATMGAAITSSGGGVMIRPLLWLYITAPSCQRLLCSLSNLDQLLWDFRVSSLN